MNVSEKQDKDTLPISPYVLRSNDINQIVSELQYIITEAGLTPSDTNLTQILTALRTLFDTISSTKVLDNNGTDEQTQAYRNRSYEAALTGGVTLAYPDGYIYGGLLTYNTTSIIDIAGSKSRSSDGTQNIIVSATSLNITTAANWASGSVPTLTSLTIYIWAVYNSGSPKYLFDDSTGSNITGQKQLIAKLKTDASSQILSTTLYSYSNPPTIIDYFRDGDSWYRVWSDGTIEQGGVVAVSGNDGDGIKAITVNLLLTMQNANYNVSVNTDHGYCYASYGTRTTTTLVVRSTNRAGNVAPAGNLIWSIKG